MLAVHDPGQVTGTVAGPCRTRDGGRLPDPACTPGAVDRAVTQADIGSTICAAGYTDTVRPLESQTEAFKWHVAEPAYGQHDVSGELDHLVPLELGGDNDAANLWVEAGPLPNSKDSVEDALNHAVCGGEITLRTAQREIAANWITAAAALGIAVPRPARSPSGGQRAWCTATASYSSRYGDWDVYVHSNQPDAAVTASSGSHSNRWHTDASGYADVYLRGPAHGQTITVTAGSARCARLRQADSHTTAEPAGYCARRPGCRVLGDGLIMAAANMSEPPTRRARPCLGLARASRKYRPASGQTTSYRTRRPRPSAAITISSPPGQTI